MGNASERECRTFGEVTHSQWHGRRRGCSRRRWAGLTRHFLPNGNCGTADHSLVDPARVPRKNSAEMRATVPTSMYSRAVNPLPLDYTLAVKDSVSRVTGGGSRQNMGDVSQFGLEITASPGLS
jgi:hypothetical protein